MLKGGENVIKHARPILLIEGVQEGDEIVTFLSRFGYRLFKYENDRFISDECGSPNSFFITEDKYRMIHRSDE